MEPSTTIGRLLVEKAIPKDMRDRNRIFNKKSTATFFQELAEKHPEEYVDVLHRLNNISRVSGTEYGDIASLGLDDLDLPPRTKQYRKELRAKIHDIAQNPEMSADVKQKKIVNTMIKAMPTIQKMLIKELATRKNAYGLALSQGFRGSPTQLIQLMFGDMLVADHKGHPVPIPGLHGYGEGVTPAEYWAGSYAARKGYCLAQGTLVRMADMSVCPIERIEPGMIVLGSDMKGNTFPVTVLNRWNNGVKEVWAYRFRVGRSSTFKCVQATEAHKILGLYKEGDRANLREICKLPLVKARRTFGAWPAKGFCPGEAEEELAYTYGQILGDGSFGDMSVTLTSRDEKELLRRFGFTKANAPDKTIPEGVYELSEKSLFDFVEGYFEADGFVCAGGTKTDAPLIRFHSTSLRLLEELRDLLETRLGVYCAGITTTPVESISSSSSYGYAIEAVHDSHDLRISHRDSVARLISGFHGRGVKSCKALSILSDMPEAKIDECLVFSFKDKEFLGDLPTWDLEVDHDDHLFVLANGIVVSNSDVQFATAKTGFLGKQLTAMSQHVRVTGEDCGAKDVGILVDGDDPEIIGSVLARTVNGIPAGKVIDKKDLPKLRGKKPLVRSLLTCQQKEGVCQKCSGKRDQGSYPAIGSQIGIDVGRVVSEPMTQGMALCLDPHTEVRMADWSIKKLMDIVPGDIVLGANIRGQTFPSKVISKYDNGLRDVYRYTYRMGSSRLRRVTIECSDEHKILTMTRAHRGKNAYLNGKVRMLPAGHSHKCVAAVLASDNMCSGESANDGFLLGLLLGDGCYTDSVQSVNLSCADEDLIVDLADYLRVFDLKLTKLQTRYYWKVSSTKAKTGARNPETGSSYLGGYSNYARGRLKELGMLGKYPHEKSIPDDVFHKWDNDSVADFISGFFVADGSVYKTKNASTEHYSFCSSSEKLIQQLKDLLQWRFGVYSGEMDVRDPDDDGCRKHPLHSITIGSRHSVLRMRELLKPMGIKAVKMKHFKELPEPDTRVSKTPHGNLLEDTYRCNRISSEYLGHRPTMDIEVDNSDHLFVLANGMIVSNSAKHTGGVIGVNSDNVDGFEEINQFVQVPKVFRGAAVLAPKSGRVRQIVKAPQGGHYLFVEDQQLHIPEGRKLQVGPGAEVEAGDVLTAGTPNPADIAKYKGLGEGRRYFQDKFYEILKNNGVPTHRRNVEVLSRAFFDRVRITDPDGLQGYIIGDIVPYGTLQRNYEPRKGSETLNPKRGIGQYLERPVLHYSIGTKITPKIAKFLTREGIENVVANKREPAFEPQVTRAMGIPAEDPDWKIRMAGFGVKRSMLEAVRHGSSSKHEQTSMIPKLMDPSRL